MDDKLYTNYINQAGDVKYIIDPENKQATHKIPPYVPITKSIWWYLGVEHSKNLREIKTCLAVLALFIVVFYITCIIVVFFPKIV